MRSRSRRPVYGQPLVQPDETDAVPVRETVTSIEKNPASGSSPVHEPVCKGLTVPEASLRVQNSPSDPRTPGVVIVQVMLGLAVQLKAIELGSGVTVGTGVGVAVGGEVGGEVGGVVGAGVRVGAGVTRPVGAGVVLAVGVAVAVGVAEGVTADVGVAVATAISLGATV